MRNYDSLILMYFPRLEGELDTLNDESYAEFARASRVLAGKTEVGDEPLSKVYSPYPEEDTSRILFKNSIVDDTINIRVKLVITPREEVTDSLESEEDYCDFVGKVMLEDPKTVKEVEYIKLSIERIDELGNYLSFKLDMDNMTRFYIVGEKAPTDIDRILLSTRILMTELNCPAKIHVRAKRDIIDFESHSITLDKVLYAELSSINYLKVTYSGCNKEKRGR